MKWAPLRGAAWGASRGGGGSAYYIEYHSLTAHQHPTRTAACSPMCRGGPRKRHSREYYDVINKEEPCLPSRPGRGGGESRSDQHTSPAQRRRYGPHHHRAQAHPLARLEIIPLSLARLQPGSGVARRGGPGMDQRVDEQTEPWRASRVTW